MLQGHCGHSAAGEGGAGFARSLLGGAALLQCTPTLQRCGTVVLQRCSVATLQCCITVRCNTAARICHARPPQCDCASAPLCAKAEPAGDRRFSRKLHVAFCVLHVAFCVLHAACCHVCCAASLCAARTDTGQDRVRHIGGRGRVRLRRQRIRSVSSAADPPSKCAPSPSTYSCNMPCRLATCRAHWLHDVIYSAVAQAWRSEVGTHVCAFRAGTERGPGAAPPVCSFGHSLPSTAVQSTYSAELLGQCGTCRNTVARVQRSRTCAVLGAQRGTQHGATVQRFAAALVGPHFCALHMHFPWRPTSHGTLYILGATPRCCESATRWRRILDSGHACAVYMPFEEDVSLRRRACRAALFAAAPTGLHPCLRASFTRWLGV